MATKIIDGKMLTQMIIQGGANLTKHVKIVDALNVYPVPDGDTGTNMNLTMTSGVKEVRQSDQSTVNKIASSFSKGLLMGSRGNSGVILSQLFRGFAKGCENKKELSALDLANAFESGVVMAYKQNKNPVEGTILTVSRESAKQGLKASKKSDDVIAIMENVLDEAKESLKRTPDLLPILKEVGVVDSGGQGLVYIYEGFLAALKGENISDEVLEEPSMQDLVRFEHQHAQSFMASEDIEFGYCTEVMVKFEEDKLNTTKFDEDRFRDELSAWGDSLLVIADEGLLKIHIHSEQPGEVINLAQRFGSFVNIKVENMREQHTHLMEETKAVYEKTEELPKRIEEYGIVTVSMGDGIEELFKSMGATVVIKGGQTMNPSTEDIVNAIKEANAKKVFILPNNGNILMAAKQAVEVTDVHASVIESKSVPQGLAALLAFNPSLEIEQNQEAMNEAMSNIKTGQVTFAVRDYNSNDNDIEIGDFMGMTGKDDIITSGKNQLEVAKGLLDYLLDEDSELLTVIWGEGTSAEEAEELCSLIEEEYPDVEVELHEGKQPLYSYIFSIE